MVYALRKTKKKPESPRRGSIIEEQTKYVRAPVLVMQTWRHSAQFLERTSLISASRNAVWQGTNAPTHQSGISPEATDYHYFFVPG
jgi:hypothetical protein